MVQDAITAWFSVGENALAAAQVAVALVTALATLALWRVTRVLAAETSALAKMTSRPFVVCALESSDADATALNLILRNTGNAAAFDIRLELSPSLPLSDDTAATGAKPSTHKVSLLPPGQALPLLGIIGRDVRDLTFNVSVSWASRPTESNRETLSYNIIAKDGFRGGWRAHGQHQIAEELGKIREHYLKE